MEKMITLKLEEYEKILSKQDKKKIIRVWWQEFHVFDKDNFVSELVKQIEWYENSMSDYEEAIYRRITKEIEKDFLHRKWIWYYLMWVMSMVVYNIVTLFIF